MIMSASNSFAQVKWVSMSTNGKLPDRAIGGGKENGQAQYVCRAKLSDNGYHPGKLFKSSTGWVCNCAGGDNEIVSRKFDVLVSSGPINPEWKKLSEVSSRLSSIGVKTLDGHGNQLYPGLYEYYVVLSNKGRHVGKLWKGKCEFGYGGSAIKKDDAEKILVLVINDSNSTATAEEEEENNLLCGSLKWVKNENGNTYYEAKKYDCITIVESENGKVIGYLSQRIKKGTILIVKKNQGVNCGCNRG